MTGLMLMLTLAIVNGQSKTRNTTARQVSQQTRIAEGVNDKELTRPETARLEREQRRIQIEKRIAKGDGTVTPAERRFLRKEQNRASRHIYRQKNDAQERRK